MASDEPLSGAVIALENAGDDETSARADIVARVLDAFQQATFVLAASRLGLSPNVRFKPSAALRSAYSLDIAPFTTGSFAIPISFDTSATLFSATTDVRSEILGDAYRALRAVADADERTLRVLMPDPMLRGRFLREASRAVPQVGEQWTLRYKSGSSAWVRLSAQSQDVLQSFSTPSEAVEQSMTVIGDLIKIDFSEKALSIRYRPNNREIRCTYTTASLEAILERYDEPIQVTGWFILGDDGHPRMLSDVFRVEPVNLEPSLYRTIEVEGEAYIFDPPLFVTPALSEDQQLFRAIDESIGLDAFASSREELEHEVVLQLRLLWREYVDTNDKLSDSARAVRETLSRRMRRV